MAKRNTIYLLMVLAIILFGCAKPENTISDQENNPTEKTDSVTPDNSTPESPEPEPPEPEKPNPEDPNPEDPQPEDPYSQLVVLDNGISRPEKVIVTPHFPELEHEVEYFDFYNPKQDYLDDYENLDYVCYKGDGTADPILTTDYFIRFYQGSASKGGGYISIRSAHGAKILSVEVGSATKTILAYSLDGKVAKNAKTEIAAGEHYKVAASENCEQVRIYCMGTTQSERWEMNYIKVNYKGGLIKEDFDIQEDEYGPLVQLPLPFTEDFETGFPVMGEKPSYYKAGQTDVGRANLQWSTWFGCISWQKPISGAQTAQLRIYQEDEEYEKSQYGYLKGEFFIDDLTAVEFDYKMTSFYMTAAVSYCEFGSVEWKNIQKFKLTSYNLRDAVQHYVYSLDSGIPHDAKIKIEISSDTSFPSKDSENLYVDNIKFVGVEH